MRKGGILSVLQTGIGMSEFVSASTAMSNRANYGSPS